MSGNMCAVFQCNNSYKNHSPGVTFHRFPKSIIMKKKWAQLCGRGDKFNTSNGRICSEHFLKVDFKRDLMNELLGLPLKKEIKEDVVPSLKLFEMDKKKSKSAVNQKDRGLNKNKAGIAFNLSNEKNVIPSELKSASVTIQSPIDEPVVEAIQNNRNLLKNKGANTSWKLDTSSLTTTDEQPYKELLEKPKKLLEKPKKLLEKYEKLNLNQILIKKKLANENKKNKILIDQLRCKKSKYKK